MGYLFTVIAMLWSTLTEGVAIHLVFSVAGVFFLGLPTVGKIAGYTLAILERSGVAPELAAIAAIFSAVIFGGVFALLYIRVNAESFAAVSLGSLLATEGVLRSWDSLTNGVLGIAGIARPSFMSSLETYAIVAGLVALAAFLFEAFILATPLGRVLRAYRESPLTLDALGIASLRVAQIVIVVASVVIAVMSVLMLWRVQFVDPSVHGIPFLIELLTIGVIAFRPRLRVVALASLFVTILPELLRFLDLPSAAFAQLRVLIYAVLLVALLYTFAPHFSFSKRSV